MHNLKIIFRNLRRNNLYSIINIAGMAISLTACILIMFWVQDETSYDKFHKRHKDIYQSVAMLNMNGKDLYWKRSSNPVGVFAKNEIPEIESFCRVENDNGGFFKYGDKQTDPLDNILADSSFFTMFNFPLVTGDVHRIFPDRTSIVLSRQIAGYLFGDEDPIDKIITGNGNRQFHVTGVFEDMPGNTEFHCDAVLPYELLYDFQPERIDNWGHLGLSAYFTLRPGADANDVARKISDIQYKNMSDVKITYFLQPISENRFHEADGTETSSKKACRLFLVAVAVLLLIACVNYVNLVTARISRRDKELSIKKILGAHKWKLFFESMTESAFLFILSLLLATIFLFAVFPYFRDISGKNIVFHPFSTITLAIYGITFLAVNIFAGIFPAVSIALRKPAALSGNSLKDKRKGKTFRQLLVVTQFAAAIVLILGSITINQQMNYLQQKELGYNKEHLVYVELGNSEANRRYDAMKTDLLQNSSIAGVTSASQNILGAGSAAGWHGEGGKSLMVVHLLVDADFIPDMEMQLVDGKNFSNTDADKTHFILNETAVNQMGLTDPVGSPFHFNGADGYIIGVVKDFNFKDLHEAIEPIALQGAKNPQIMYVRVKPNSVSQAIETLEKVWKSHNDAPLKYAFLDDAFDKIYKSDIRTKKLFLWFAVIAILVSCLGLFGLVTYTAETRTKEIGIRKVLGANVASIVEMISKEFLILVGIAMLIAFPLAYYWLDTMLQDYAYRVSISWWMFVATASITVVLTLVTVGFQAVKAATANPVKAIKSE